MSNRSFDIELAGCTPEPLMAYLKALGILRLVGGQKDPSALGWWRGDTFWLKSALDEAALRKFFLEEYTPTALVAPWAGGSGFFKKDNKKAVDAIGSSGNARLAEYRSVIRIVRSILQEEEVFDRPSGETKIRLLERYRRELPTP
jgi:CRISPR-associated protein Csx17